MTVDTFINRVGNYSEKKENFVFICVIVVCFVFNFRMVEFVTVIFDQLKQNK